MLHCHGGYFYVGQTDELEHRIAQHKKGLIAGFTADHQPVEHVWSQDFPTREEAKAAERQIKGWSRAKKLALIRGDWGRISVLAKKKDGPSTSSGWSGEGERSASSSPLTPKSVYAELVEALPFSLQPHPQTPSSRVQAVTANLRITDGLAWLTFEVANAADLNLPPSIPSERTDGLWQTTCFELFVAEKSESYREFNFSPSTAWAAYRFEGYRSGMKALPLHSRPDISAIVSDQAFTLIVAIDARLLPQGARFALSAVIEERDGTKSYWALAHPPGAPDFHHPTCFAATLPAPSNT